MAKQKFDPKHIIGVLIYRAFYSDKSDTSENLKETYIDPNLAQYIKVKQEKWANMGDVITKRRRGKYVTWQRLGT